MRIVPHRSTLYANSFASTKVLVSIVLILVVVLASVFAAAYYFLTVAVPARSLREQTPTPTGYAFSLVSRHLSPSTSTPNLPSSPTPTVPSQTTYPKYSLSEAISAGYVEASITGVTGSSSIFNFNFSFGSTRGASSGDCIILHIKRLVNYTIEIDPIPMGTLLVPNSADAQTMAVLKLQGIAEGSRYRPREIILLQNSDPVEYLFSAYCVNFEKDNPTELTVFTQSGSADANVLKIFNALSQLSEDVTSVTAIQTAVFVVTNDVSQSELKARFTSDATAIQNAKTILQKAGVDTSNKRLFAG